MKTDPARFASPVVIGRLDTVLVGKARPYTRPGSLSAIDKQPVSGPVRVDTPGLDGDEQGDRRVHGGPDKAVHCYPSAHYPDWLRELASAPAAALLRRGPGAFGENFSVSTELDEAGVCLADQWAIGDARFEVSQARQPCWKLNDRFGVPDMARRVQTSLRPGWYLRVLQAGRVQAGDPILRVARPYPDWPLARLLQIIDARECTPDVLRAVLELPLPASWQKLFRGRLARGVAEDWGPRLNG